MNTLKISLGAASGVTVLSNAFIDQYMIEANDAQLKVYLYLLRLVTSGGTTDVSELADVFNYTEKDITRAISYWDKKGVLELTKDANGCIEGIDFADLTVAKTTKDSESCQIKPVISKETDSNKSNIVVISMDYENEKKNYSLDDIAALTSNGEVKMLINVFMQYFGRPLNPEEIRTIVFIYDRLGFSFDLADFLADYCVGQQGEKSMHFVEKVAINWFEQGIDTIDKARGTIRKTSALAYDVMKALGKGSEPTATELDFINRWNGTYGFDLVIIEDACKRAVLKTDKNRFQYADSILTSWHKAGVRNMKDVEALDADFEKSKAAKSAVALESAKYTSKKSAGSYDNIMTRDYDFDAVERALARKILG